MPRPDGPLADAVIRCQWGHVGVAHQLVAHTGGPAGSMPDAVRVWTQALVGRDAVEESLARGHELAQRYPRSAEARAVDAAINYAAGFPKVAIQLAEEALGDLGALPQLHACAAVFLAQQGETRRAWDHYRDAGLGALPTPAHRASAWRSAARSGHRSSGRELLRPVPLLERGAHRLARGRALLTVVSLGAAALGLLAHNAAVLAAGTATALAVGVANGYLCGTVACTAAVPLAALVGWGAFPLVEHRPLLSRALPVIALAAFGAVFGLRLKALAGMPKGFPRGTGPPAGPWPVHRAPPVFTLAPPSEIRRLPRTIRRDLGRAWLLVLAAVAVVATIWVQAR